MRRQWWLRLVLLQWMNHWRVRPVRRSLLLLGWWVPAVLVPAAVALAGGGPGALDWLLSFDMPLALLLSAQVGAAIVALATRRDPQRWLVPPPRKGARRALSTLHLLHALRWPAAVVIATLLLRLGGAAAAQTTEALFITGAALLAGAALAWLLGRSRAQVAAAASVRAPRGRAMAALSWVPLREAWTRLHLRRLALLAIPVMLAAPMGTTAQQVLRVLAAWVPMLFLGATVQQTISTMRAMHRWLPRLPASRLAWWVWRHVGVVALLVLVGILAGARATARPVPGGPG